jgi:uridylate kinase
MKEIVLLKITGEALGKSDGESFDKENIKFIVGEIKSMLEKSSYKLAIVLGGGNFIRGKDLKPYFHDKSTPDRIGMICTILNALTLKDQLEKNGIETRVMSSLSIPQVCEPYIQKRALRHIEKGRTIIFSGGVGIPNFTTDMAAVEKALDIHAGVVLKATKVDGLYTSDPNKDHGAKIIKRISCTEVLKGRFSVMDHAAFGLAEEKKMLIRIFNLFKRGNLLKAAKGKIGSEIY